MMDELAFRRLTGIALLKALNSGELSVASDFVALPEMNVLMAVAGLNHDADLIDILVEAGAEVDAKGPDTRMTALSFAAAANPNPEIVSKLIEYGADYDHKDTGGRTPLHWAARAGHCPVVLALLPHVSNIDEADLEGRTALMIALEGLHVDVADALIEAGADKAIVAGGGLTALAFYELGCADAGIQPAPALLEKYGAN